MSKNSCRCSEPSRDGGDFISCKFNRVGENLRWLHGVTVSYCIHCGRFWFAEALEVDLWNSIRWGDTYWIMLKGRPVSWKKLRERKYETIPEIEEGQILIEYGDNITTKQRNDFAPIIIAEKTLEFYDDLIMQGYFCFSREIWNPDVPPKSINIWVPA